MKTLRWGLGLLALLCCASARADLLDPAQFASLGTFAPTQAGTYTVTGTTLTEPNGTTITGVVFHGIDVFTFNTISLANG
jgi:hypothetical protein